MDENSFESEFDKWKKQDVKRLKEIQIEAEWKAGNMPDGKATEEYGRLIKRGQGVSAEPLLNDEEKALRDALAKRFGLEK